MITIDELKDKLEGVDIRVNIDKKSGQLNGKIKNAQLDKVPYMLIVGKNELSDKTVSVRHRLQGNQGAQSIESFIQKIIEEERNKINPNMEVKNK